MRLHVRDSVARLRSARAKRIFGNETNPNLVLMEREKQRPW